MFAHLAFKAESREEVGAEDGAGVLVLATWPWDRDQASF